MVILKSIKSLLSKFSQDLGSSIYRIIVKIIGYLIVFLVIGFCATRCTKAMTISDNLRTINETQLTLFEDYAKSSKYKYYVIASEYNTSGYNNYYNYYLCLTNEQLDVSSPNNLNTTCNEIYRYNNTSNNYSMTKINDNNFTLNNSTYYTNYNSSDLFRDNCLWFLTIIGTSFLIYAIIVGIFRGFL